MAFDRLSRGSDHGKRRLPPFCPMTMSDCEVKAGSFNYTDLKQSFNVSLYKHRSTISRSHFVTRCSKRQMGSSGLHKRLGLFCILFRSLLGQFYLDFFV